MGSGPAGLAAAQQLNRAGHWVTIFEKADRPGGLLRYGIPDFKLEKRFMDRRLGQLMGEGIRIETRSHVGRNVPVEDLREEFHAILLAGGAEQPRDLSAPGRELKGIHFAKDFLTQQNKRVGGDTVPNQISAGGKRIIILGGGDTGSDCLGTSNRHGARSVHQFELLPQPPEARTDEVAPFSVWIPTPPAAHAARCRPEFCESRLP